MWCVPPLHHISLADAPSDTTSLQYFMHAFECSLRTYPVASRDGQSKSLLSNAAGVRRQTVGRSARERTRSIHWKTHRDAFYCVDLLNFSNPIDGLDQWIRSNRTRFYLETVRWGIKRDKTRLLSARAKILADNPLYNHFSRVNIN